MQLKETRPITFSLRHSHCLCLCSTSAPLSLHFTCLPLLWTGTRKNDWCGYMLLHDFLLLLLLLLLLLFFFSFFFFFFTDTCIRIRLVATRQRAGACIGRPRVSKAQRWGAWACVHPTHRNSRARTHTHTHTHTHTQKRTHARTHAHTSEVVGLCLRDQHKQALVIFINLDCCLPERNRALGQVAELPCLFILSYIVYNRFKSPHYQTPIGPGSTYREIAEDNSGQDEVPELHR